MLSEGRDGREDGGLVRLGEGLNIGGNNSSGSHGAGELSDLGESLGTQSARAKHYVCVSVGGEDGVQRR